MVPHNAQFLARNGGIFWFFFFFGTAWGARHVYNYFLPSLKLFHKAWWFKLLWFAAAKIHVSAEAFFILKKQFLLNAFKFTAIFAGKKEISAIILSLVTMSCAIQMLFKLLHDFSCLWLKSCKRIFINFVGQHAYAVRFSVCVAFTIILLQE